MQQHLSDLSWAEELSAAEEDEASSQSFFPEVHVDVSFSPSSSEAEAMPTDSLSSQKPCFHTTPVGFLPTLLSPGRALRKLAHRKRKKRGAKRKNKRKGKRSRKKASMAGASSSAKSLQSSGVTARHAVASADLDLQVKLNCSGSQIHGLDNLDNPEVGFPVKLGRESVAGQGIKSTGGHNKARQRFCAIPGCDSSKKRFLKVHAFKEHIPEIFREDLPANDPIICSCRVKALEQAGRWLLGRPSTVLDLLSFLRIRGLLAGVAGGEVTAIQKQAMLGLCHQVKAVPPGEFSLAEPNSPGILVHWKVALLIAAALSPAERGHWKANFSLVTKGQGEPKAMDAAAQGSIFTNHH